MKKLVLFTLATAVVATPAAAQNWQGKTYGQDAIGWYDLEAEVDTFCKFGTSNSGGASNNAVVSTNAYSGAVEADGLFELDIQNDQDNTIQEASGRYDIDYAVCNTGFDMTVESENLGLENPNTTSDPAFLSTVPYRIRFRFDGFGGNASSADGFTTVDSSPEARAGRAFVEVRVPARDRLLVEGTYEDKLIAALVPNVGS